MPVRHPHSSAEAIDLLSHSPVPMDCPTQRRIRTREHLEYAFETGRRRTEWVWIAQDSGQFPQSVVAGLGEQGQLSSLDHFSAGASEEILRAATAEAYTAGCREASLFAPAAGSNGSPDRVESALRAVGWSPLVTRAHYEFEPAAALGTYPATDLSFFHAERVDDPRLLATMRQILENSLDAHDRIRLTRQGGEATARANLDGLLCDGLDTLWLPMTTAGETAGLASAPATPSGRAFVSFIGVVPAHRGNGYAAQILAWLTRDLIAQGATTLIADTDECNTPMLNAFAAVGWPVTERRIDLTMGRRQRHVEP